MLSAKTIFLMSLAGAPLSRVQSGSHRPGISSFAVQLSRVEQSPTRQTEISARLWQAQRAFNHPTTTQMLVLLQSSIPQGVKIPAAIVYSVESLNCPRCVSTQKRTPNIPQESNPECLLLESIPIWITQVAWLLNRW
jgi:hypothetical protein